MHHHYDLAAAPIIPVFLFGLSSSVNDSGDVVEGTIRCFVSKPEKYLRPVFFMT